MTGDLTRQRRAAAGRRRTVPALVVALAAGCGGGDGDGDQPAREATSTEAASQRLAPLPTDVIGTWRSPIRRGEDTESRHSFLPAGAEMCVRLTKRRDTGCYTIEPIRGPGARMWRREGRGRFVEYGPAGTLGGDLVWQVAFEPLGTCTGTTTTLSYEVAGDRMTLRPESWECTAHEAPFRLVRE